MHPIVLLLSAAGQYFPLTVSDYLLGLSDLTGELMRFAISGLAKRGGRKKASEVCAFVRGCKAGASYFYFNTGSHGRSGHPESSCN